MSFIPAVLQIGHPIKKALHQRHALVAQVPLMGEKYCESHSMLNVEGTDNTYRSDGSGRNSLYY